MTNLRSLDIEGRFMVLAIEKGRKRASLGVVEALPKALGVIRGSSALKPDENKAESKNK